MNETCAYRNHNCTTERKCVVELELMERMMWTRRFRSDCLLVPSFDFDRSNTAHPYRGLDYGYCSCSSAKKVSIRRFFLTMFFGIESGEFEAGASDPCQQPRSTSRRISVPCPPKSSKPHPNGTSRPPRRHRRPLRGPNPSHPRLGLAPARRAGHREAEQAFQDLAVSARFDHEYF